MLPYINEDAEKASFVGTGTDEEIAKTDEVYDTMYDYYVELLQKTVLSSAPSSSSVPVSDLPYFDTFDSNTENIKSVSTSSLLQLKIQPT